MKILQDRQNALIATLDGLLAEQTTANEDEKKEINANIQQVTELKHQCETTEEKNLEKLILESYENLLEVCKTTAHNKSVLSTKPVNNSSIRFIPNPEFLPLMQKVKLGDVAESVTDPSCCSMHSSTKIRCGFINEVLVLTKNSQGNACHTSKGMIDVQIQDVDGNNVQKELTETETGKFLVKHKVEKRSLYKVVVSIGGKEIKNSPQNIETIDAKAEFESLAIIDVKERMSGPIALDVSHSGDIAVVNNSYFEKDFRVVLFNADGEYLRDIGGAGSGDGQLSDPTGVIFNEDKIVITDNPGDRGCIKVFGIDGNYKRTLCKLPEGMMLQRMCTVNQTMACLYYNKNRKETFIKLFDIHSCDHLHDIKLDVPDDVHGMPVSLAYDNNKYFVSFYSMSIVYVFDENGGLLYTIGMKGNKKGQFNGVSGLAVFGKEMLLVCDGYNHRVQVFSQDGQFINSFGSKGAGLGQMNDPYDVSVTPEGRVFVLEWNGKRVQVWR
ncbi:E3 ubiquitin-protein ligase TRIM71-like [Exaiptasia diaphana]|nr:E3 ubiquitin-protein ligase TRIM71-like [Exaiptasia diaphana]